MARYQKHGCKDCGEPLYWDDSVRSEKTGNRIPLNSDYRTKHYTTCAESEYNKQHAQQEQPQQQQQVAPPMAIAKTVAEHQEIIARLDRIDTAIKQIARAVDGINAYFQKQAKDELDELQYDKDREEGFA